MSATRPPLAPMISAIRSTARSNVASPMEACLRSSRRVAIPAGSRSRPIGSASLAGAGAVSSQKRPGRRTSPPISWAMPAPSLGCRPAPRGPARPAARRSAATWSRQSTSRPPAPAPDESHRCCHVAPGCSSSQSRIFSMDSLRQCRALASPKANGAASSRRATVNLSAAVSGHDSGTGRGGNLASTAAAWALSCRAAVPAAAGAVTSGPSRTARPGSRAGNPAPGPEGRAEARPAAGDAPARPR